MRWARTCTDEPRDRSDHEARIQSSFKTLATACCSGASFGAASEEDDGWPVGAVSGGERREVGVGGEEDSAFCGSSFEDLPVGYRLEAVVADVHGVVAGGGELFRQVWREGVVHNFNQGELTLLNRLGRLAERPFPVAGPEVGIRGENLLGGHAVGDHADGGDRYPEAAEQGTPPI